VESPPTCHMVAGTLCGPTQCQANNYIKKVTDCHTVAATCG